MSRIRSSPEGGSGPHHCSNDRFQEAVDSGCCICNRFHRLNGLGERTANLSELDLSLSYEYKPGWTEFKESGLPEGTLQITLNADKFDLRDLLDGTQYGSESLFLNLVPIQAETTTTPPSYVNKIPNSLKASTTGSSECLALGTYWLRTCIQQHTNCDRPLIGTSEEMLPSRLVYVGACEKDAPRLCLRENLPAALRYATLSHCWGVIPDKVVLTQNIFEAWQRMIPDEALMPTFKDAIKVTRSLGMQYLWIDSICIIQDSQSDWLHESSQMSNVYKYAHCNIAATAADSDLSGMFSTRDPMLDLPARFNFADIAREGAGEGESNLKGAYDLRLERTCSRAEILHAHVDLATEDEFGLVVGGYLELKGKLLLATPQIYTEEERLADINSGEGGKSGQPLLVGGVATQLRFHQDGYDPKLEGPLYCMPISFDDYDAEMSFNGLMLQPTGVAEEYRRVGSVELGIGDTLSKNDPITSLLGEFAEKSGGVTSFSSRQLDLKSFRVV
ncbi:MAG: hypothetical protein Q9169_006984 [Polycauliona sp. 2 TL-2023]